MKSITKTVGTREEQLGSIVFPVYEAVDEAVDSFGAEVTVALINKSLSQDLERIAREGLKAGMSEDDVQEKVNSYKPGIKTTKPSLKNFTNLAGEFTAAGNYEALSVAYEKYNEEGVESAFNYLKELKDAGKV